jgi:hypothetical protein
MSRRRGQPLTHELPPFTRLVPPDVAADKLGVTTKALRNARNTRRGALGGLRYYRFGPKSVKYDVEDLRAVREKCLVEPKVADR